MSCCACDWSFVPAAGPESMELLEHIVVHGIADCRRIDPHWRFQMP